MKNLLFNLAIAIFLVTTSASAMSHGKHDIVDVASKAGVFNTLIAAAKAAGLVEALKGEGPITVFAPTDDAFAKLPEGTIESLLKPENKDKLTNILLYHVVSGEVMAKTAITLDSAKTLQGSSFSINLDGKTLKIDGASVTQADIKASNGVIHVIDSVILPKSWVNLKNQTKIIQVALDNSYWKVDDRTFKLLLLKYILKYSIASLVNSL